MAIMRPRAFALGLALLACALDGRPALAAPVNGNFVLPAISAVLPTPKFDVVPDPWFPNPNSWYMAWGSERGYAVGDVDGDHLADIVMAPSFFHYHPNLPIAIWINKGNGAWEDGTAALIDGPVPLTGAANSVFIADFNGDGRNDIFIVDQGLEDRECDQEGCLGGRNTLLLSGPDGKLHDATSTLPDNGKHFNHVSSIADVNGDGHLDIILTRLGGPKVDPAGVLFLFGDGKGGFVAHTEMLPDEVAARGNGPTLGIGTSSVCDLDGDERPDLIVGSYGSFNPPPKALYFYRQGADGRFSRIAKVDTPLTFSTDPDWTGGGMTQILCGDLHSNGRLDLVVSWEVAGGRYVQIFRNDGNFQFVDVTLDAVGRYVGNFLTNGADFGAGYVELVDFNGDGTLDLYLRPTGVNTGMLTSGAPSFIYLNDGKGKFTPWQVQQDGLAVSKDALDESVWKFGAHLPLVLDVNGDGSKDVVLVLVHREITEGPTFQTKAVWLASLLRSSVDLPLPPPTTFALTVAKAGTGSGVVTGIGIDCGHDCTETYVNRTSVTLTAMPGPNAPGGNYIFAGWGGNCSSFGMQSTCTLSMNAAKSVTATFAPPTFAVAVSKTGTGNGTVTGTGIDCGSDCGESYLSGTGVTLTATPNPNAPGGTYVFAGWGGACSGFGTQSTCTLSMNATRNVSATFSYVGSGSDYSRNYVQKAYVAYYGRPADPGGQSYWAGRMDAEGQSLNAIIGAFGYADEFNRRYGGLNYAALVTKIYQQTLGRNPDQGGLNYYVGELQAGRRTLQSITLDVLNGATTAPDSNVVANKLDVAAYYTAKVAAGCLYGTEQDGVNSLVGVTAISATVTAAKAAIDTRCGL